MKEPTWVDKEGLLLLHGVSLARFGGAEGIRDEGLLDSALARPVNRYQYADADAGACDLADLAAAYAFGLAKNHAFIDGNKRVALLACGVFLMANGKKLDAPPADMISAMLALADGSIGEVEFAAWIRRNWRSA